MVDDVGTGGSGSFVRIQGVCDAFGGFIEAAMCCGDEVCEFLFVVDVHCLVWFVFVSL